MNLFGLSSATYSQIFTDSIPANSGIIYGFYYLFTINNL